MCNLPEHLRNNFNRFKTQVFDPNKAYYEDLAKNGQHPETMVVACCDSRVDPVQLLARNPGEVFVDRNVANLVPPCELDGKHHGVSAALEYAVCTLKVKDVVILGHRHCGGIAASFKRHSEKSDPANFTNNWVSILDEAYTQIIRQHGNKPEDQQIEALEKEGIKTSLANLETFPFVSEAMAAGNLSIHGALFDIGTGTLLTLNRKTGKFKPLP